MGSVSQPDFQLKTWLAVAGLMLWLVAVCDADEPGQWRAVRKSQPTSHRPAVSAHSAIRQTSGETPTHDSDVSAKPASPGAPGLADGVARMEPNAERQPEKLRPIADAEPITLHLDDVDVRKALELLSREGSLNILVSPNVSGRVTANLQDLSVDQALDAILKLCGLTARREQRLIYIYTPDEISQVAQKDRKTSVRFYRLNYLKSTDLLNMITPFLSENGKVVSTPPSQIGIATNDDHAGGDSLAGAEVVVVQDDKTTLKIIDDIVFKLDVQPVQVLIEAVILNVTLEKGKDLGVNFAVLDGAGRVLNVVGNGVEINAAAGFTPSQVLTAGGKVMDPTIKAGFAANTHGLKFGFVDKDVTGFIRALERVGETNVLAAPRLLVLNKQRAEIQLGRKLGYKTLTVTETASVEKVEFLNTGTQLRLRPFVSADGTIRMEIHPERSSGFIDEKGVPQASTSEVTTNVMVPDGSTIVIGGLMDSQDNIEQSGVPGLSRLRWIGGLFRQKQQSSDKKELIVLLTPHICNPSGQRPPNDTVGQASMAQTGDTERSAGERQTPVDGPKSRTGAATAPRR